MEAIIRAAAERYGSDVEQAYCARNPEPVSYVTLDISHQGRAPRSGQTYWETMSAGNYKPLNGIQ
jgi:hypothetical protein